MPEQSELVLALPALNAERWLRLLPALRGDTALRKVAQSNIHVPESVTLCTPARNCSGQQWHDVVPNSRNTPQGNEIHTTWR
ncbi:MAG: hypothetical protein ACR5LF_10090 [Symbiopectobacterium sp.]